MRRAMWAMVVLLGAGCGASGASREAREPTPSAEPSDETAAATQAEEEEAPTAVHADGASGPRVPAHGPLSEDDLRRGLFARLGDRPFPGCQSSALPPAYRRRTSETPTAAQLAGSVAMSVPANTISAGTASGVEAAIYLSTRIDPESPAEDHGYRVLLRQGGGAIEDLALGLSFRRPFVFVHNPMVPIVGEEILALEANMRELDDESLEWPLLAGSTRTRREAREILVQCALADLRRDRDEDGLTDLEEERLLTDAWDADTDGDGVRDGDDPSPLSSARAESSEERLWLAAYHGLVRTALGDSLALVVRSGSRLDVGESAGRALVLREDELSGYVRRFGRRPFVVISATMRGADRAEVSVSIAGRTTRSPARLEGERWLLGE